MRSQTLNNLVRILRYLPRLRLWSLGLQVPISILPGIFDLLSVAVVARLTGALSGAALQDQLPGIHVFGGDRPEQSVWLIGIFIILSWSSSLTKLLIQFLQSRVCAAIWRDLSTQAFDLVLRQQNEYHLGRSTSELAAQILQNYYTLALQIVRPALLLFSALTSVILLSLGVLVVGRWLAAGLILCLALIYSLFSALITPRLRHAWSQQLRFRTQSTEILAESLASIRDIQLASAEPYFLNQFRAIGDRAERYDVATQVLPSLPRSLIEPVGITLIFAIGALPALLAGNPDTIAAILPFLATMATAALKLTPPLQDLFKGLLQLRGALPNLSKALNLLDLPASRPTLCTPGVPSPEGVFPRHTIRLHQISYRYPGHQDWVLNNVNLTIPVGARVALVGATGSGKTTTAQILLGLLQPQIGHLELDGIPVEGLDLPAWQASCAHVPQSITLLNRSILENVAFGMVLEEAEASRDCVWDALEAAQLQDFVADLPYGLFTQVGENGLRLSGGQRQRLALARAFFRQARFLVLDEATSALDNRTESEVIEALEVIGRRCTTVVIAHRLSTVQRCDRIFELDHGSVKASGSYADLQQRSDSFRELALLEDRQASA